jgi:L-ascorbate metabolism protein UlaG (beta-lactamase superfamily)
LRITAVPAHHAHDPALDVKLGKGNGYVLVWEGAGRRYSAYWTGDSVLFDGQREAIAPFGSIDLLLPHMGAVGCDGPALRTMGADEASVLIGWLEPKRIIPIHHTTFGHYREPIDALLQRAAEEGFADRLRVVREGGVVDLDGKTQPVLEVDCTPP